MSLTPMSLLIIDCAKSPIGAAKAMARPSQKQFIIDSDHGYTPGNRFNTSVVTTIESIIPPMSPSYVLLGLTRGAIFDCPVVLPMT